MNAIATFAATAPSSTPVSRRQRSTVSRAQANLLLAVHALALLALAFPRLDGLIALAVGYVLTGGLGISLGYHRCLSHNAFAARPAVRAVLALLGVLAFQGGPLTWIGFHRAHHRFTDREGDPHSAARGFWWSHIGWAWHKGPNGYRPMRMRHLVGAAAHDPLLCWLERHNLALNAGLLVLLAAVLGPVLALWAVPLRIVVVWHMTWLTNSIAHRRASPGPQGTGPAPAGPDSALNVRWLAVLNFGEGLHRNHHAVPGNAGFAHGPGEVDPGYLVLRAASRLQLVTLRPQRPVNQLPTQDAIQDPSPDPVEAAAA